MCFRPDYERRAARIDSAGELSTEPARPRPGVAPRWAATVSLVGRALGLLPLGVCVLVAYALRPAASSPVVAPVRLALVRSAVLVGGCAVVGVEVLSVCHALTAPAVLVGWAAAALLAGGFAVRRYRRDGRLGNPPRAARTPWKNAGRAERVMAVALAVLVLAELLIAAASPPNNYDSQTYHLPRIEHWVQQHDVSFYATRIHRQVDMAPGAEYLLLHLRLLTGGDALYNLLQLCAGLGCALVASRVAAQLGGSARAQLVTAFIVASTPTVALESTSTQVDLVVAAWVACVATLVLDELRRPSRLSSTLLLGAGTGLAALTKVTGLLAVGPLLLIWLGSQLRLGWAPARRRTLSAYGGRRPAHPRARRGRRRSVPVPGRGHLRQPVRPLVPARRHRHATARPSVHCGQCAADRVQRAGHAGRATGQRRRARHPAGLPARCASTRTAG